MKTLTCILTMVAGAALLSACDPRPSPKAAMPPMSNEPVAGGRAQLPPAPPRDPSVPPADQVLGAANAGGGTDTKATQPKGDLNKKEESEQMPKAGQANNHSSPSLGSAPADAK